MKQQRLPGLVVIFILTAITTVLWVAFSVYRVLTTKPAPDIPSEILAPLTATLDENAIGNIQKSIFFEESQIQTPTVLPSPTVSPTTELTPSPSPTLSASASASPTITSSPSGSPGGGL